MSMLVTHLNCCSKSLMLTKKKRAVKFRYIIFKCSLVNLHLPLPLTCCHLFPSGGGVPGGGGRRGSADILDSLQAAGVFSDSVPV